MLSVAGIHIYIDVTVANKPNPNHHNRSLILYSSSMHPGLSHPFLGMGPGPTELGKLAAFCLKLGNLTSSLGMTFPLLE